MNEPVKPIKSPPTRPLVFGKDDPPKGTKSGVSDDDARDELVRSKRALDASRRFGTKPPPLNPTNNTKESKPDE